MDNAGMRASIYFEVSWPRQSEQGKEKQLGEEQVDHDGLDVACDMGRNGIMTGRMRVMLQG